MTKAIETQFDEDWTETEEMDTETEMDDTDELDFDDFDEESEESDDELEASSGSKNGSAKPADRAPVWRLIEMSRESRRLHDDLADFEDYEFYDSVDSDLSFGVSH